MGISIYVYADESGVFDYKHNDIFVFSGLIFLSKEERDLARRRYQSAEKHLRHSKSIIEQREIKAASLNNKHKGSMYRAMNPYHRFGVVIDQKQLQKEIFDHKKSKQRFLDYAFKRGLKNSLQNMIKMGQFTPTEVDNINVFMDEHTTATDGRYELRESLEQEFKIGIFNHTWQRYFPPLFPKINSVEFQMKDSCQEALIRAADITANRLYYATVNEKYDLVKSLTFLTLPK